jgi:hypothetical protein
VNGDVKQLVGGDVDEDEREKEERPSMSFVSSSLVALFVVAGW